MTAADWIDNLERKAKAATPGPWSADDYGSGQQVTGATGTIFADTFALPEDAKFIAAADPDTILRLIEDNRRMRHGSLCPECNAKAWGERADFRRERDVLRARLAAVEDLVAEWERVQEQNRKALGELARGTSHLLLDTPGPADFRAALAAPTDTTKEN